MDSLFSISSSNFLFDIYVDFIERCITVYAEYSEIEQDGHGYANEDRDEAWQGQECHSEGGQTRKDGINEIAAEVSPLFQVAQSEEFACIVSIDDGGDL